MIAAAVVPDEEVRASARESYPALVGRLSRQSAVHNVDATMRTTTSPAFGFGFGTSSMRTTSGGPYSR